MTEERKQNFPKPHVKTPVNKTIVFASIVLILFLLFLYSLICLTQECAEELNEAGSWTCFWPLSKDCPPKVSLYCTDMNNYTCNYVSDSPEYHVHMFVWIGLCDDLFPYVTELQMWEHDRHLHFADDRLRDCQPEPRDIGLFKCHHRSTSQIEGIFKGQDPEIYFKIRVNCSTDENPDCGEFFFSTLPAGELIPKVKENECFQRSKKLPNFYEVFHDVWFFDLDVGSEDFPEVSQLDNWFVWKCIVQLNLSPYFNDSCSMQEFMNQYTPISFSSPTMKSAYWLTFFIPTILTYLFLEF